MLDVCRIRGGRRCEDQLLALQGSGFQGREVAGSRARDLTDQPCQFKCCVFQFFIMRRGLEFQLSATRVWIGFMRTLALRGFGVQ